jgi:uncharacterized integral membrane protein
MNARMQVHSWIYRTTIALSCILAGSVAGIIVTTFMHRPLPQLLAGVGLVAIGGLVRLWISPLNQSLFE